MRAKEESEFTRTEVECSKEKAEEEAYDAGVAEIGCLEGSGSWGL